MKFKLSQIFFLNELVKKTGWYRRMVPDMDNYPTNEWYRKNLQRNYDVVNIGSSSARYAFDYRGLPLKAFNWAEQPQSLSNGYKVLRKYYGILKKGGTVIISISPFSGFDVSGKWPKDADDKYFYILDPYSIEDYESVRKRRKWPLYFNFKASLKALKDELFGQTETVPECRDFRADAHRWMNLWLREFGMESVKDPMNEANSAGRVCRTRLLGEIVGFCRDRGLRPVIVLPPVHPELYRLLTPEFIDEHVNSFVQAAAGEECEFFNLICDDLFRKDEYYRNAFMLNERGAGLFTENLLKRLAIV